MSEQECCKRLHLPELKLPLECISCISRTAISLFSGTQQL